MSDTYLVNLLSERDELRDKIAEMEVSFLLRWNADMRAIKQWQAKTGRTATWPDHADLVCWLLDNSFEALLAKMESTSDAERKELFCKLGEVFCRHCGRKQEGSRCQCWNDD